MDHKSLKRRHIQSSVVIPIETRSRNDTISELKKAEKKEDVVRNQRMFGNLLLGTLDRFRKDEGRVAPTVNAQVKKQMEIDKRLEQTKVEDRERMFQHKHEMFEKRREEEIEIKKQRRAKAIEFDANEKEAHFRRLQRFIQTQAKPPLFYLPAKHTPETEKLLDESSKSIEALIEKLRADSERKLKGEDVAEDDLIPTKLASKVVTNASSSDEDEKPEVQNGIEEENGGKIKI